MEDYKSELLNEEIESLLNSIYSSSGVLLDNGDCTVKAATAQNSNMIPCTIEAFRSVSYLISQELSDMNKYTAAEINMGAQRKMIVGRGAPHASYVGALHQLYRDNVMNRVYYCSKIQTNRYQWKPLSRGRAEYPDLVVTTIEGATVTVTCGDEVIQLYEVTSGTYYNLLSGTGDWVIHIAYGSDAISYGQTIDTVTRYLIDIDFSWRGELTVSDDVSIHSLSNPFHTITETVATSTQIPIPIASSQNVSVHTIENSIGTFTDSASGAANVPQSGSASENVSMFTLTNMFGFTDSVSVTTE